MVPVDSPEGIRAIGFAGFEGVRTTGRRLSLTSLSSCFHHSQEFIGGGLYLVAAVWYDNVLIAVTDGDLASRIHAALLRVTQKAKVVWKHLQLWSNRSMNRNSQEKPAYLGMTFRKTMNADHRVILEWQPSQKRREKWSLLARQVSSSVSCLTIAKLVGVILWCKHISFIPLCRARHIIAILRRAAVAVRRRQDEDTTKDDWSQELCLSEEEQGTLKMELQQCAADSWCALRLEAYPAMHVTTDSSDDRRCHLVWDQNRQLERHLCEAAYWPAGIVKATIFVKELAAATIAIERVCKESANRLIILSVDNSAAAGALRRLASPNLAGNELCCRVDRALTDASCRLAIVTVRSEHNPADTPTRKIGLPHALLDPKRLHLMWIAIQDGSQGLGFASRSANPAPVDRKRLRHPEESDNSVDASLVAEFSRL